MAFSLHGVHVPHRKNTQDKPAARIDTPKVVTIPMSMHIGAPARPVVKVGDPVKIGTLSAEGLKDLNGNTDVMNNADFVYDAEANHFYAVSDCHPSPSSDPNYISSHFRITYFDKTIDYESVVWNELATVGGEQTGYPRNHNTGVLRDGYGHLPNQYISAFYTISIESPDALWAYRIYDCHVNLP